MSIFFFAVLLAIPLNSLAGTFHDGNQLNRWVDAYERASAGTASTEDYNSAAQANGYITATSDAFDGRFFCNPEHAQAGQIIFVVRKYIKEHPESWNNSASSIIVAALKAAFPCTRKK